MTLLSIIVRFCSTTSYNSNRKNKINKRKTHLHLNKMEGKGWYQHGTMFGIKVKSEVEQEQKSPWSELQNIEDCKMVRLELCNLFGQSLPWAHALFPTNSL